MYLRAVHSTFHIPTLYSFLKKNPLGVLTTYIPRADQPPIQASHLPWVLDVPDSYNGPDSDAVPEKDVTLPFRDGSSGDASVREKSNLPLGTFRGHLSRANPQAKALIEAAKAKANSLHPAVELDDKGVPAAGVTLDEEVYLLFTGPVSHYVTPKFYVATKPTTGKVVPTWNYEAVQAYGKITVYPSSISEVAGKFLSKAIDDLSHQQELQMGFDGVDGPKEWLVSDAPEKFIHLISKSIVGVEIEIMRLGGKFKMSQEMSEADREGVVAGFARLGREDVSESVRSWGLAKDKNKATLSA